VVFDREEKSQMPRLLDQTVLIRYLVLYYSDHEKYGVFCLFRNFLLPRVEMHFRSVSYSAVQLEVRILKKYLTINI